MVSSFISHLTPRIGIDAGTERIRLWSNTREEMVDQASCLAIERSSGRVIQVGDEAEAMLGRVADDIEVVHPLRRGEVVEPDQFRALIQVLLQQVMSPLTLTRPVMMMSVPAHLSEAKRQLLAEIMRELGVYEFYTINQSLASAIGAGVPIADATGTFVVQLGAGLVEASVISLGSSVASDFTWYGGHWLDEYLQVHLASEFSLKISLETAREIKHQLLSLSDSNGELAISGQALGRSAPTELILRSKDVIEPAQLFLRQYEVMLGRLLANLPPELSVDVIDKGLLMSGGLANLSGLDQALVKVLGVPVSVVESPSQTVINGLATALEHLDEFKQSLGYRR